MHVLQGHPILADCLRRVSQNQSPATGPIKSISQKVHSAPCFSIPGHHLRTNSATETSPGSHCGHVWAPCREILLFVTNPREEVSIWGTILTPKSMKVLQKPKKWVPGKQAESNFLSDPSPSGSTWLSHRKYQRGNQIGFLIAVSVLELQCRFWSCHVGF